MPERRKGPTRPRVPPVNVRWNKSQIVEVAKDESVTGSARESVHSQSLAALIEANELLRDQNRMIWYLLQAQEPKSSTTASDTMEPTEIARSLPEL